MKGVDYSWARPGGAEIKAAGFDFAIRYVDYPGASGKGLRAPELEDLHANGIAVGLVYESTAGRPLEGLGAGRADAHQSLVQMRALGFPEDRPVFFAVDFDAQNNHFAAIYDYFAGAGSVLGVERVGIYGGIRSLQRVAERELATWFWQALAWSNGQTFPVRHIYQYLNGQTINGGAVDYNEAFAADFGQWPVQEDIDMSELEDLILACYSGQEEASLTRAERLANARYRMAAAVSGAQEPNQKDRSLAQRIEAAGGIPPGTKLTVEVLP